MSKHNMTLHAGCGRHSHGFASTPIPEGVSTHLSAASMAASRADTASAFSALLHAAEYICSAGCGGRG